MSKKIRTESINIKEIIYNDASKAIEILQKLVREHGDGHLDLSYGDCGFDLTFEYFREETDIEYSTRIRLEQAFTDKERKEYERLKAKFGDK